MELCTLGHEESVHVGQRNELLVQALLVAIMQLEALAAAQQATVLEHVEGLRVQRPVGSLSGTVRTAWNFNEAIVEAQVVPQRVLPALGVVPVVREPIRDVLVDIVETQHLLRRAPDRHRSQRNVRVGGLLIPIGFTRWTRHGSARKCSH